MPDVVTIFMGCGSFPRAPAPFWFRAGVYLLALAVVMAPCLFSACSLQRRDQYLIRGRTELRAQFFFQLALG
jgi:hypothetical protein